MNEQYIIEDTRYLESFKDKSFSGFKKTDVIKKTCNKCICKSLIRNINLK